MSKTQEKKAAQGNILELFLLDTSKIKFWMENLTQRCTQPGPFSQNQDTFKDFQKRAGEHPRQTTLAAQPPSPP